MSIVYLIDNDLLEVINTVESIPKFLKMVSYKRLSLCYSLVTSNNDVEKHLTYKEMEIIKLKYDVRGDDFIRTFSQLKLKPFKIGKLKSKIDLDMEVDTSLDFIPASPIESCIFSSIEDELLTKLEDIVDYVFIHLHYSIDEIEIVILNLLKKGYLENYESK